MDKPDGVVERAKNLSGFGRVLGGILFLLCAVGGGFVGKAQGELARSLAVAQVERSIGVRWSNVRTESEARAFDKLTKQAQKAPSMAYVIGGAIGGGFVGLLAAWFLWGFAFCVDRLAVIEVGLSSQNTPRIPSGPLFSKKKVTTDSFEAFREKRRHLSPDDSL